MKIAGTVITSLCWKVGRFLFRLDSGNDALETLKAIAGAGKKEHLQAPVVILNVTYP